MKHVFVSHSRRDREYLQFLSTAFAASGTEAKYEEYEALSSRVAGQYVANDIRSAEAVFVLLTENVERLQETRDWVAWECGVAHDKEVWVFEPAAEHSQCSVVIPRISHYVAFHPNDKWIRYVRDLLSSMSKRRAKALVTTAGGTAGAVAGLSLLGSLTGVAVLALPPVLPIIALGAVGVYLTNRAASPSAQHDSIRSKSFCCEGCGTEFTVHREGACKIRCPICNRRHELLS